MKKVIICQNNPKQTHLWFGFWFKNWNPNRTIPNWLISLYSYYAHTIIWYSHNTPAQLGTKTLISSTLSHFPSLFYTLSAPHSIPHTPSPLDLHPHSLTRPSLFIAQLPQQLARTPIRRFRTPFTTVCNHYPLHPSFTCNHCKFTGNHHELPPHCTFLSLLISISQ